MVSVFKSCSSHPRVNSSSQVLGLVCFKLAGVVSPLVVTGINANNGSTGPIYFRVMSLKT